MFRFAKNATAAFALTGLALSQPAMAVRSSDSLPAANAKAIGQMNRVGTPLGRTEQVAGASSLGLVLGAVIAVGALVLVLDDNKNHNKSPG